MKWLWQVPPLAVGACVAVWLFVHMDRGRSEGSFFMEVLVGLISFWMFFMGAMVTTMVLAIFVPSLRPERPAGRQGEGIRDDYDYDESDGGGDCGGGE